MPRPRPKPPRNLAVVDLDTAEMFPVGKGHGGRGTKRPNSTIGDFAMIHLDHTGRLYGMTGTERDVLDALVRRMERDKPFHYLAKDVAKELGIDPAVVSRAQKTLVSRGLLIKLPDGRSILDPRVFWLGNRDKIPAMLNELAGMGLLVITEGASE